MVIENWKKVYITGFIIKQNGFEFQNLSNINFFFKIEFQNLNRFSLSNSQAPTSGLQISYCIPRKREMTLSPAMKNINVVLCL